MAVTDPGTLRLTVAGPEPIVIELDAALPDGTVATRELAVSPADRATGIRRFEAVVDGWVFEVTAEDARRAALRERAGRGVRQGGPNVRTALLARIPGRVVRVWVAPGDRVEAGQRLVAVEAMKMENEIRSPRAGTVRSVAATIGQTVDLGDELAVID